MALIKAANLAVRFLLELCVLAAVGYWGFQTGQGLILKLILGLGAPLLVAVFWGIFLAPASSRRVAEPWRFLLEVVVFGLAVAALATTGHATLAWALGLTFLINRILI